MDWNEFLEFKDEEEEKGNPSWRVRVEYTDGTRQDMSCYDDQLGGKPKELYYRLLEYFETEEDLLTEELRMSEYSIGETAKEDQKQIDDDAAYCLTVPDTGIRHARLTMRQMPLHQLDCRRIRINERRLVLEKYRPVLRRP